jgi:hypothetical protein
MAEPSGRSNYRFLLPMQKVIANTTPFLSCHFQSSFNNFHHGICTIVAADVNDLKYKELLSRLVSCIDKLLLTQLTQAPGSMFQNGEYSDLTIICNGHTFSVHKNVVFRNACKKNTFKVSATGVQKYSQNLLHSISLWHLSQCGRVLLGSGPRNRKSLSGNRKANPVSSIF